MLSLGKRIKQLHLQSFFMLSYNESSTRYDASFDVMKAFKELEVLAQELEEMYELRLKRSAEAALVQSVPEVGDSNGLDQDDLLLLEEMLGESYHDRSVESDVLAQGGGTEEDRKILSPRMQEGARNKTRGLSTRPHLSKVRVTDHRSGDREVSTKIILGGGGGADKHSRSYYEEEEEEAPKVTVPDSQFVDAKSVLEASLQEVAPSPTWDIQGGDIQQAQSERFRASTMSTSNCSERFDMRSGEDQASVGANLVGSVVGSVDIADTDPMRFDEWKQRIRCVPEAMDKMVEKLGFADLMRDVDSAMADVKGPLLREELIRILRMMQGTYRMSDAFAGAALLSQVTKDLVYKGAEAEGAVARTIRLAMAVNGVGTDEKAIFWDYVEAEGRIEEKFATYGGTSAGGPGLKLFRGEPSREAWQDFIVGWFMFLAAGDKRVIDIDAEKSKLFATSEEWHELWQRVKEDKSLEDCEEWFSRFRIAFAGLKGIENLEEGRRVLMPTMFQQCKIALACMHPEFKAKFNVAVQARIVEGKRVKMHDGVPVFADFDEMKKLMREAQVFWDDDPVSCGYIDVRGGDGNEENSDSGAEEFGYGGAEEVVYGGAVPRTGVVYGGAEEFLFDGTEVGTEEELVDADGAQGGVSGGS